MATPDLTQALLRWRSGDPAALEEFLPHVYDEMRRLAGGYMRRERVDHPLQPTALVHEAFIRKTRQREVSWQNRAHFMVIVARAMRPDPGGRSPPSPLTRKTGPIRLTAPRRCYIARPTRWFRPIPPEVTWPGLASP